MSRDALRIPRPRVLSIQRVHPGRFSVGDAALVKVAPGLLRFLNLQGCEKQRIGNAFAPEWVIGLGAASTAAGCAGQETWGWTGISLSVDWFRASTEDEHLLARSVVELIVPARFGKVSLVHSYEVVSEETKEVLARGKIVLGSAHPDALRCATSLSQADQRSGTVEQESPVSAAEHIRKTDETSPVQLSGTGNEGPVASHARYTLQPSVALSPLTQYEEPPEDETEDLFRLERPSIIKKDIAREDAFTTGDCWEWLYPGDLFRILINPIGGGTEPIARRIHPFGLISLGAALHASLQLSTTWEPKHADVRWLHPIRGGSDFRLSCRLRSVEGPYLMIEGLFYEADTQVAQVKLAICNESAAMSLS